MFSSWRARALGRPQVFAQAVLWTAACVALFAAGQHPSEPEPLPARVFPIQLPPPSVLRDHLLVTWYGNPNTGRMGVLGRYKGNELASGLMKQAAAYARITSKKVIAAYHLVAIVAQPSAEGVARRREAHTVIQAMLTQAHAHGFKLIVDIQPGHSTVAAEMEYLRSYLEDPDVYLALDPEFAMPSGIIPGRKIGRMTANDVNTAIDFLENIIRTKQLPPKVLIVHQFTLAMLADKQNVRGSALVDVVLDVDGFGDRPLKRAMYATVNRQGTLEFPAIKLFYKEDTNLFAEKDVMALNPQPTVVIYQ